MARWRGALGAVALLAAGCATAASDEQGADGAGGTSAFERDRAAILAMTGDYHVTFHFEEVVALAPGYELVPPKDSGGEETVFVVEDTGDLIRLQHVLVVGPEDDPIVVKHWRQDWRYEPKRVLDYVGDERWETRAVTHGEAEGAWSQTVYQVDDSPRYAAVAAWRHGADGVSTWESPVSWRPLPRRDATTRDDYDVVQAVNRHTITPWGWAHEQDNEKLVLAADGETRGLVREIGVNSYRAIDAFPMEPVTAYWEATETFWSVVRARWDALEATSEVIAIEGSEPDDPIYAPVLEIVAALEEGEQTTSDAIADFEEVLAERVTINGAAFAAAGRAQLAEASP
ncbi:MAG: hypothetical protein MI723_19950 [Caulobacterales bacterium]|nr:hypothetical protein [Caulobacterales bacterium]